MGWDLEEVGWDQDGDLEGDLEGEEWARPAEEGWAQEAPAGEWEGAPPAGVGCHGWGASTAAPISLATATVGIIIPISPEGTTGIATGTTGLFNPLKLRDVQRKNRIVES